MSAYLALFRIRFSAGLQYRAAALGGIATQFAWGFMLILQFAAFYRTNPDAFPMTPSQIASYIWMQQALLALFMTWFVEHDILSSITSGSIAYELARPMNLYNRWFCQATANRVVKATLRFVPILLIAFLLPEPFRMTLPENLEQLSFFLVSTVLALCVVVAFSMFIYTTVFYTLSSAGVRLVASVLADFFAGAIIPLPFFPDGVRQVVELLPFAAMQNMPLRIYSGSITGSDVLWGLGLQAFWLITLVILGKLAMRKALTKVIVQGG
ncbi:MAG: ABC transporter permease [Oscillospiraceae bacterium]|nr:ABC transporter permease [Oscillospiraceae bacterium]